MDYTIVELQETIVMGVSARTNNFAPDCGAVIGGLWEHFYSGEVYDQIPKKTDGKVLGIYSDYAVRGDVQKAVMEFWQKLWTMKLDRSFIADFEEYQNCEMEDTEIHIYIGLK